MTTLPFLHQQVVGETPLTHFGALRQFDILLQRQNDQNLN